MHSSIIIPECVVMRHGDTADTLAGIISGWRETELTPDAKEKVAKAAWMLAPLGIRTIVSSDLKRAATTAQIVATTLGLPAPRLDPLLRERHWGQREGQFRTNNAESGDDLAPAGGESLAEVNARVVLALGAIEAFSLIVTHAGPIRFILQLTGRAGNEAPCTGGWIEICKTNSRRSINEIFPVHAYALTAGNFHGRITYIGRVEDLAKIKSDSIVLLMPCPKTVALMAMERAAATVNLTKSLTAHLSYGRVASTPYAVAFSWPNGYPREGQQVTLNIIRPPARPSCIYFPDVKPESVSYTELIGGKAAGLLLLKVNGFSVPIFRVVGTDLLASWTAKEEFHLAAQGWMEQQSLDSRTLWAVRSSANVEDGVDDPMSGAFESILDLSPAAVPKAIERVLTSTESIEIRSRIRSGTLKTTPRMAIIVQEMVQEPLLSGAVFIPAPDDPATLLVEGRLLTTGEALMDGRAVPDVVGRYDIEGKELRYEAPFLDVSAPRLLRERVAVLAKEAIRIYLVTGRGDIEYAIDKSGTIWWLQARVQPAVVEIVDRRGFSAAAQNYYRMLAFRVNEANCTPPIYFRCVDLPDGRFGYSVGIYHRDRLFHQMIKTNPTHLAEVTRFGWETEEKMSKMIASLADHTAESVLDLLTLHGAVQLPFSIPMGGMCIFRAKVTKEYGITYQGKRAN